MDIQEYYDSKIESLPGLDDYWNCNSGKWPRAGDFILFQMYDIGYTDDERDKYIIKTVYKPILAVVVEGFQLDMACAIHYVQYRDNYSYEFDRNLKKWIYNPPKVEMVYDWMNDPGIVVLGFWNKRPTFLEVYESYKTRIDFDPKNIFISEDVYSDSYHQ